MGSVVRAVLSPHALVAGVGVLGLALFLREAGVLRFALPQNRRQIDRNIAESGFGGMLQFGFEMGTACRTFLPTGAPHLIAIAVLAFASFPQTVAVAVAFGVGRSLVNLGVRVPLVDIGQWRDASERSVRTWSRTLFLLVELCTVVSVVGFVVSSGNV